MADDIKKEEEALSGNPSEIERIKSERDEYLNGWKRTKADFLNYQKEEGKRMEEVIKFGAENILKDIVSAIDNLALAFNAIEKRGAETDKGLLLIKGQLEETLKKHGVVRVDVKSGDEYNPMYHEAIAMIDSDGKLESGKVSEQVEPGYTIHGYVLKPARVKVVK